MIKKRADDKTHFIAVILPQELEEEVGRKREWMRLHYNTKSGYSTRPHITLVPPFCSSLPSSAILSQIREIASSLSPFSAFANGYGSFGDRTLFINVEKSPEWTELSHSLEKGMRGMGYRGGETKREFSPHITIANRDIPKGVLPSILFFLSREEIKTKWTVDSVALFHREGYLWKLKEEDIIHF